MSKWKDKRKSKKAARDARKADRKGRKDNRRGLRDRRKLAKTEALERGEGFFQNLGKAAANFGEAQVIAANMNQDLEEQGMTPGIDAGFVFQEVQEKLEEVGGNAVSGGISEWFSENWGKVAIGVGIVAAGVITYKVVSAKPKTRKK